jgi:hypothetical protein
MWTKDGYLHKEDGFMWTKDAYLHKVNDFMWTKDGYLHKEDGFMWTKDAYVHKVNDFMWKKDSYLHKEDGFMWTKDAYVHKKDGYVRKKACVCLINYVCRQRHTGLASTLTKSPITFSRQAVTDKIAHDKTAVEKVYTFIFQICCLWLKSSLNLSNITTNDLLFSISVLFFTIRAVIECKRAGCLPRRRKDARFSQRNF